jgi:hypothetical protein
VIQTLSSAQAIGWCPAGERSMIDSRAWEETHPAVGPNAFVIGAAVPHIAIIAVSEIELVARRHRLV